MNPFENQDDLIKELRMRRQIMNLSPAGKMVVDQEHKVIAAAITASTGLT